jgi:hypothetical protein
MAINVLIGGKFGDFIHCLYVPNYIYKTTGIVSNIFICDSGNSYYGNANFEFGLENTYKELCPIVLQQEYCNCFKLWSGENIDVNTIKFRDSQYLYKTCWTEILTKTFFESDAKPIYGSWMKYNKSFSCDDTIFISRKPKNSMNRHIIDSFKNEIKKYKKAVFLGPKEAYEQFPLKHLCSNENPQTLSDWFVYFNSATAILANQSGPGAIACALNKKRTIELLPKSTHLDDIHYIGETKYSSKMDLIYPNY